MIGTKIPFVLYSQLFRMIFVELSSGSILCVMHITPTMVSTVISKRPHPQRKWIRWYPWNSLLEMCHWNSFAASCFPRCWKSFAVFLIKESLSNRLLLLKYQPITIVPLFDKVPEQSRWTIGFAGSFLVLLHFSWI